MGRDSAAGRWIGDQFALEFAILIGDFGGQRDGHSALSESKDVGRTCVAGRLPWAGADRGAALLRGRRHGKIRLTGPPQRSTSRLRPGRDASISERTGARRTKGGFGMTDPYDDDDGYGYGFNELVADLTDWMHRHRAPAPELMSVAEIVTLAKSLSDTRGDREIERRQAALFAEEARAARQQVADRKALASRSWEGRAERHRELVRTAIPRVLAKSMTLLKAGKITAVDVCRVQAETNALAAKWGL